MSFLSPLFLLGAAAIAIPIAIHLFYRSAEPLIEFSAMRYLRLAPVEQSQRRRLRELLLLALRVAALLLLALAFARPYLSQTAVALGAPATVVLIDTSVSMSAPGLFQRALTRASEVIRTAPPTHAVAVVAFARDADVVAPLSEDRAGALAAIAQLKSGAGMTRYRVALSRAADQLGDRTGRIVVISDLQQSGWNASDEGGVPDRVTVEVEDVGGPETNLAVTSLRAEGAEAVADVRNYSPRSATEEVVFSVDAQRLGAVAVTIPPDGSAEARIGLGGRTSGGLSASIKDSTGFAADNTRYAILDSSDAPSVLAITDSGGPEDALYLERAVSIAEGAGGFRFRTVSGPVFSALRPDSLADVGVIVVLGTRGLEQRGRERLAGFVLGGGGLLLTAGPNVEPSLLGDALSGIVRTTWRPRPSTSVGTANAGVLSFAPGDSRHPVFRLFAGVGSLGNVSFTRAALVNVADDAAVLARYSDGSAAMVEERTDGGRVIVFGSDLNNRWNDFPLQPAFVPFVHETLRYLASARASRSDYLVGDLPGVQGSRPGVISVPVARGDKARPTRVAINIDPRESDPSRMTAEAFRAGVTRLNATAAQQARTDARDQEDGQRLWQYGLLLMVVSLAAEGILGRRLG